VNVHDLLKILSGFGKYQDHAKDGFHKGDIDQNHEVDVDDLLFVLKHFDRNCKGFIRTLFG
jgi:Ca2+-binding EF-hand superfamily protein